MERTEIFSSVSMPGSNYPIKKKGQERKKYREKIFNSYFFQFYGVVSALGNQILILSIKIGQ